jgi:hypothetical protein
MRQLTGDEVMILVGLLNHALTGKNPPVLMHGRRLEHNSMQGRFAADPLKLVEALLEEAERLGAITKPACFEPRKKEH